VRQTISKAEILRGRKSFDHVFQNASRIYSSHLRCLFLQQARNSGTPPVRFGVVVARSVKRAVDRNRVKRLVRESYRRNKVIVLHADRFQDFSQRTAIAIVFVYAPRGERPPALPSYQVIEKEIQEMLGKIAARISRSEP
jgi:ribonuclease P protein component